MTTLATPAPLSRFERFLTLWVALCFVAGIVTGGDPLFTLSQVALNDTIMLFAFAPLVGLLLGISSITVPWNTLRVLVVLQIAIPVAVDLYARRRLLARGPQAASAC